LQLRGRPAFEHRAMIARQGDFGGAIRGSLLNLLHESGASFGFADESAGVLCRWCVRGAPGSVSAKE
ncbi:MAG: hypothetical protein ABI969_09025, partial [bacterium]